MFHVARRLVAMSTLAAALIAVPRASVDVDSAAADIQLQLGSSFLEEGRYLEALDALERAVKTDNAANQLRARMGLVRALLRLAEFGRARGEAETVLKARPKDAEALALYGDSLWASGLFEEAERAFVERRQPETQQRRGAVDDDRGDQIARRHRAMEDGAAPEIRG
jgi:Tfp pilus assembly protein PilF